MVRAPPLPPPRRNRKNYSRIGYGRCSGPARLRPVHSAIRRKSPRGNKIAVFLDGRKPRIQSQESKAKNLKPRIQGQESKAKNPRPRIQSQESKVQNLMSPGALEFVEAGAAKLRLRAGAIERQRNVKHRSVRDARRGP